MSEQEHAMQCPTCGSPQATSEVVKVPKADTGAHEGQRKRPRLTSKIGAPPPGSAVPIFHVLCDAGVVGCGISPSKGSVAERLALNILVYFAKHRFGCPGLERFDYEWSISSPHSIRLEIDLDDITDLHSEPAQEWDRKAEFVKFAQKHGNDAEWLQIAATICHIEDEMRKDSVTPTREEMIDEARQWYIYNSKAVPGVYDDIADMLVRGR